MRIVKVEKSDVESDHIHVPDFVYRKGEYAKIPFMNRYVIRKSKPDKQVDNRLKRYSVSKFPSQSSTTIYTNSILVAYMIAIYLWCTNNCRIFIFDETNGKYVARW